MAGAEVFLLTHSLSFQAFTYSADAQLELERGDIVAVPFRTGIEAGVVAELRRLPRADDPQIKPVLAKLSAPDTGASFGGMLLALAQISLCSPKDICDVALWGLSSRFISLELSAGKAAPPQELKDEHQAALALLGRRRSRITPALLKKLSKNLGLNELVSLICHGSLKITGHAGFNTQPDGKLRKLSQETLFPNEVETIPLKSDYAVAREIAGALGMAPEQLKVPGRVITGLRWADFAGRQGRKLLLGGTGPKLLLVPTHWHVERIVDFLPARLQKRTFAFNPEMPAAEYQRLEKLAAQNAVSLIIGTRAAHFLMLQTAFAEVILLDPTAEEYESGQYPHYSVLADCMLLGAASSSKLTLLPQGPLPFGLGKMQLSAEVIPLPPVAGQRIEKIVDTIGAQAKPGKQLLVYNNALGRSQEARCLACRERVRCPQCGRNAAVDTSSSELICAHCGMREAIAACPECGSKQLSIEIIGVDALAKRVRAHLRHEGKHPAPRVGTLSSERREKIRVPNLARTDVLIGTSTLFTPLPFYKPSTIIFVAQDAWHLAPHGVPEEAAVLEAARLMSLYGNRTKLIILAPRALADSIQSVIAQGGTGEEWDALKRQYSMPPYNVQVDFTAYGQRESALRSFVEEMNGQLEYGCELLDWQTSRAFPRRSAEGGWYMRGSALVKRYTASAFADLRRRAKGKHIDLVFNPRYY